MVKYAAKRPLKNISSEPSQIMTPTASKGGRSGTWRGAGAVCSTDSACVTASFLADGDPFAPTPWRTWGGHLDGRRGVTRRRAPSAVEAGRQRARVDDDETLGGSGERHVEGPQTLWRFVGDGGRFHHHDGVEFETVGQIDG